MSCNVAAIILAAGSSRRMGDVNKLLMEWRGKTILSHVVGTSLKSVACETIVVTGHENEAIARELAGYDVRLIHNPRFDEGLSTSLIAGIKALGAEVAGAAILLADMPDLKMETLNALINAFEEAGEPSICAPVCGARRGNPVTWPREFFPDILQLSGDRGARDLMATYKDRVQEVGVEDNGVLMDFDSPDDIT